MALIARFRDVHPVSSRRDGTWTSTGKQFSVIVYSRIQRRLCPIHRLMIQDNSMLLIRTSHVAMISRTDKVRHIVPKRCESDLARTVANPRGLSSQKYIWTLRKHIVPKRIIMLESMKARSHVGRRRLDSAIIDQIVHGSSGIPKRGRP